MGVAWGRGYTKTGEREERKWAKGLPGVRVTLKIPYSPAGFHISISPDRRLSAHLFYPVSVNTECSL